MSIDSSGRSVGYNILNGTGSEPQKSQHEVYVRFDRADAIEPLLAYVKCTYYINNPIGRSGRPRRHFGIFSKRFEEGACIWLRGEPSVSNRPGISNHPGVSSCPSLFLYQAGTSRTVCFKLTQAQFIASPASLCLAFAGVSILAR